MTDTQLQAVVTRNIRVLMAVRGIETQKDLAAQLGWIETKLTKSLKGDRKWSLEDLPELADALGVEAADLIRDLSRLVTASVPSRTGTDGAVITAVNGCYPRINPRVVIPFPQAGRSRRRYHRELRHVTEAKGRGELVAPGTGHSFAAPVA